MLRLAALLCFVGAARALDETCSTLWSKITHLGCRPHDDLLRNQLDQLALADGGLVSMRCTNDHAFCFRADLDIEIGPSAAARSPSFLTLERRPGGARSTITPAVAASRERANGVTGTAPSSFLSPAEVASVPSATGGEGPIATARRRRLFSSPTATPTLSPTVLPMPAPTEGPTASPTLTFLPTPVPSTAAPSLTFLPTPAPSISAAPSPAPTPVPTTVEITTFAQLRNAVADPSISEILVPVTIEFPSAIEVTRNVTIVGLAADVALRDAGTPLKRLFFVDGGELRLETLHLLNNVSSLGFAGCAGPAFEECNGPVILAYQGSVELVGCTIRDTRAAYSGAGMALQDSNAFVLNCTFTRLVAKYGVIRVAAGSSLTVVSSTFHANEAVVGAIIHNCTFTRPSRKPLPNLNSLVLPHRHWWAHGHQRLDVHVQHPRTGHLHNSSEWTDRDHRLQLRGQHRAG